MKKKIKNWLVMASRLKDIKASEMELRKEICEHILAGQLKGSKSATFGAYTMTATAKLKSKLDKELVAVLWKELSKEERICLKFEPKLINKEYEKLADDSELHRAVETEPGAPALKLKALKETENGN